MFMQSLASGEKSRWMALADEFAALRRAIEASRVDVALSGYDPEKTLGQLNTDSAAILDCENKIRGTVQGSSSISWLWRRSRLRNLAYQTHHWYTLSTDDNFNWTSQATELRGARDNIYKHLIALNLVK
jgi:hypothetical protein